MTPRRVHEIRRGKDALVYRLGEGDAYALDQLPDPGRLAPFVTIGTYQDSPGHLGKALAEGFFKLLRPEPEQSHPELNECAGWLYDYLSRMTNPDLLSGFLWHVEELLQLALVCPGRLPEVIRRLAALDNAALQEQATCALCFEEVRPEAPGGAAFFGDDGGLFAGLTEVEQ